MHYKATFDHAMEGWMQNLEIKNCSVHTIRLYNRELRKFKAYLVQHLENNVTLASLEVLTIQDFRAWLKYLTENGASVQSRCHSITTVRSFFKYLELTYDLVNHAPRQINKPKIPRRLPKALAQITILEAIEAIQKKRPSRWIALRDKALIILLYATGMRISEAISINLNSWSQGDPITIKGKGNKERIVYVLPIARKAVNAYLKACPHKQYPERALFLGTRGECYNQHCFNHALKKAMPGKAISAHSFRHSFATDLLNNGANLRVVQELLGHVSITTTQIYTDVSCEHLRAVQAKSHPRNKNKQVIITDKQEETLSECINELSKAIAKLQCSTKDRLAIISALWGNIVLLTEDCTKSERQAFIETASEMLENF